MNNIVGPSISPYANAIAPYTLATRGVVGLETAEAKDDLVSPVEESPKDQKIVNNKEDNQKEKSD